MDLFTHSLSPDLSTLDHFESPRWILLGVCITGIILAYITEDGYSLLVGEETIHIPKFGGGGMYFDGSINDRKNSFKEGGNLKKRNGVGVKRSGSAVSLTTTAVNTDDGYHRRVMSICSYTAKINIKEQEEEGVTVLTEKEEKEERRKKDSGGDDANTNVANIITVTESSSDSVRCNAQAVETTAVTATSTPTTAPTTAATTASTTTSIVKTASKEGETIGQGGVIGTSLLANAVGPNRLGDLSNNRKGDESSNDSVGRLITEKRTSYQRIVKSAPEFISDIYVYKVKPFLPKAGVKYLNKFEARVSRLFAQLSLFTTSIYLKRLATSKRHFFYIMEKHLLGLEIVKGETEIDSYLDVKKYLGKRFPFMWEVARVKEDRVACDGFACTPMSSYSYLDLLRDPSVQTAAIEAAKTWSSGNHGPRMLGGNMTILRDLEKVVAKFFGRDDTILCATGYLACMSACAALCNENTVVFADRRLHASLSAGLKLSGASLQWFRHNDFKDCERLIKKHRKKYQTAWMIVESVYSMDGDVCNLPAANDLCKRHGVELMIDEAHGLGVVGKTGRGVEELFDLKGCATIIVGTFSKSIASIGGYITGPHKLIQYLDFHAAGNCFSAPLPAYCAGAALRSFSIISSTPSLVASAQTNSVVLRRLLETGGGHWPADYSEKNKYELEGDPVTTVIPVVFVDDIDRVMRVATAMKERGFMCSAAAYPACPLRRPRFRITATSGYTKEIMESFVKALVETCVEEGPSSIKQLMP